MPGPVVHSIIAEHLPREFGNHSNSYLSNDVSDALAANRRALVYGAQGPDPFFFNPNDWAPMSVAANTVDLHNQLLNFQRAFAGLNEELIQVKRDLKQEANDAILSAAQNSQLVDRIKDLSIRMRETGIIARALTRGYAKKQVLDKADPFGYYVSPMQTCGRRDSLLSEEDWDRKHEDWAWFDTLHSRRTGDFTTELLDIATGRQPGQDGEHRQRDELLAYAVGYLSHLAADTVGHAYVNTITGGPYRLNQSQRHTTQEKIMDVWAYNFYYDNPNLSLDLRRVRERSMNDQHETRRWYEDDELVNSEMHKNFLFTDGIYEPRDWERDPDRPLNRKRSRQIKRALKLPDEISLNFTEAANRAYDQYEDDERDEDNRVFREMATNEVKLSYRMWYTFFYGSTNAFSPVPPSELPNNVNVNRDLQQDVQDFYDSAEDVGEVLDDAITSTGSNGADGIAQCFQGNNLEQVAQNTIDCLEDAANSVQNFVSNLGQAVSELFQDAAELGETIAQCTAAQGPDCTMRTANYMLQQLYERLWHAYRNLLMLLTALGFSYMYSGHLNQTQLQNFYDPTAKDGLQNTVKEKIVEGSFPRAGMKIGENYEKRVEGVLEGLENEGHLVVPLEFTIPGQGHTNVEQPETNPGPDIYGDHEPMVFITDPNDVAGPPQWQWVADPEPNTSNPSRRRRLRLEDYRDDSSARSKTSEPVLGNAVDFTVLLFEKYWQPGPEGKVPNLNMSGDRAIGYPTWASANGCEELDRERWQLLHGEDVPWLVSPIYDPNDSSNPDGPVFVPRLWDSNPNNMYY